ncbi:uncharacterized protein EDB91DRAFT_1170183 [Suillus paluster]|uniref:uncharacterized protein n=1 Tax=Suillus paluster TaxID=48578 RepID=UPI001B87765C|nr:uncharacterized protein EDB91DRAFT_1179401 [Suillus paluster]XP_041170634.1 uncharacterized protein EDB91DRAFT_1170183 [Suillus paluster]KAG1719895.1 hypothetical protein EDB91DRAFT_1179401 [Suillus paluster]KAG1724766.1 hypothetical protein EDB91DRAFT_1170183 [Suillus paluster]
MPSKKDNCPLSLEARARTTFAAARTESAKLVEETNAYIDSVQTTLAYMKEQHETNRSDLPARLKVDEEKIDALCAAYSPLLDGVVHQRIQTEDTMKTTVEAWEVDMRKSRKRLMEKAKARLDDAREKQKLAMDASELVKHYKALVLGR